MSLRDQQRRGGLPWLLLISLGFWLAAVFMLGYQFVMFTRLRGGMPHGFAVAGVPVGGLSFQQARETVQQVFALPIELRYNEDRILLDPALIDYEIDIEGMFERAEGQLAGESQFAEFWDYLWGSASYEGPGVPIASSYDAEKLRAFLEDVAARYDRPATQPRMALGSLTFQAGEQGYTLDVDDAVDKIDVALDDPTRPVVNLEFLEASGSLPTLETLGEGIRQYVETKDFEYGDPSHVVSVFVMDLETGEELRIYSDVAFAAASTIKIASMTELYRNLAFSPTVDEAWLLANSMLCSNNSSTNLIMSIIGKGDPYAGATQVTETVQYLGAENTFITAPLKLTDNEPDPPLKYVETNPNPAYNTNPDPYVQTTPEDLGTLLWLIYDCAEYGGGLAAIYPDGQYNQTECKQMIQLLIGNSLGHMIEGGVPEEVPVANKNGWIYDTHGDAGIVFSPGGDYIISVFVWENTDFLSWTVSWPLIEDISRMTYNFFNPDDPLITPRDDLNPEGADLCQLPADPEILDLNDIDSWKGGS
jgi:beta-lactamase class A